MRQVRFALAALTIAISAAAVPTAAAGTTPPYGVNVVSASLYVDAINYTHLVGEVVNNTIVPVRFVRINVDLYDAGNVLVGTDFSYTRVDVLDPGEKSGFEAMSNVTDIATYKLRVTYSVSPTAANHNFGVDVTNETTTAYGTTHLVGIVTNNNVTAANFVSVEATLYDANGSVVGTDFTYVNSDATSKLQPGESASFDLSIYELVFSTYQLVADSSTDPSLAVTIAVSPSTPTYGTVVQISGRAAPKAIVTVQRWNLAAGWSALAQATADSAGAYRVSAKITTTWFVRALTDAGGSVPRSYFQKALVSLTASATTVRHGTTVTLNGLVRPAYPGKRVAIQQYAGYSLWKNIGYATLTSTSSFSFKWVPKTAGTYVLRAWVDNLSDSTTNASSSRRIVVL